MNIKKKCSMCKHIKVISYFSHNAKNKDNLARECKECHIKIRRKHYLKHKKETYIMVATRRQELKTKLKEYKKAHKCQVCSENETVCLEFHHRDPNKKDLEISLCGNRGWSWDHILREINKCDILCANCHKKRHAGLV